MNEKGKLAITGVIIGVAAVVLTVLGNPGNMGFCIACFLRDTAGAMHLHTAPIVEYVRPEIIGIILGSFALSVLRGDFRPRGGSSPLLRFIIGFIVMLGALVFLGCPLRMVIRLGGGDLNALIALVGFIAGIGVGCVFLNKGFRFSFFPKLGLARCMLQLQWLSLQALLSEHLPNVPGFAWLEASEISFLFVISL